MMGYLRLISYIKVIMMALKVFGHAYTTYEIRCLSQVSCMHSEQALEKNQGPIGYFLKMFGNN